MEYQAPIYVLELILCCRQAVVRGNLTILHPTQSKRFLPSVFVAKCDFLGDSEAIRLPAPQSQAKSGYVVNLPYDFRAELNRIQYEFLHLYAAAVS
jgi:hypothetical protein